MYILLSIILSYPKQSHYPKSLQITITYMMGNPWNYIQNFNKDKFQNMLLRKSNICFICCLQLNYLILCRKLVFTRINSPQSKIN